MSKLFILAILITNVIIYKGTLPVFAQRSCDSHSDCNIGQVCCKGDLKPWRLDDNNRDEFHCRKGPHKYLSCFGFYCTRLSDCGFLRNGSSLCCVHNKCRPCQQCGDNMFCGSLACCGRGGYGRFQVCSDTCLGENCREDSDCASNECCLSYRCSNKCSVPGCTEHWDCPIGYYCCGPLNTYGDRSCKRSCVAESCAVNNDCVHPEYCKNNRCTTGVRHECQTNSDCKNGSHECCYDNNCHRCTDSFTSSSDFPSGYSCCETNNLCSDSECKTTKQENVFKRFPGIFGGFSGFLVLMLIGAIGCYFLQRKKRQRSAGLNTVPENACSDGTLEIQQNIYNEIPLQNDEQHVLLSPNIPSNPSSLHGDVACILNIPPPAYSFDDIPVSPDRNDDLPPPYRDTQF